jgi:hypothetical protein
MGTIIFVSVPVDITAMGFIQQGQEISVKIDVKDPKIIYPNSSWARYVYL